MARIREHIVPILIGLFLGVILAAPVVATKSSGDDQLKAQERSTSAIVKQAELDQQMHLSRITALEGQVASLRRDNDDMRARLSDAAERERSLRVRASRSRRVVVRDVAPARTYKAAAPTTVPGGSVEWASGAFARKVSNCESGGNPRAVSSTGKYRGKWQMDSSFWRTYGGLQYASTPDQASEAQQDAVAYRGWQDRGWQPWSCAH